MDEAYSSLTRNLILEVLPVLLSDNVITGDSGPIKNAIVA